MKTNQWALTVLLLSAAIFQLPAQRNESRIDLSKLPDQSQEEADRQLLANIRARAEKGDARSQFELGKAFYSGTLGVTKDYAEAMKWFRKAAEQNYAEAQAILGGCYAYGTGVTKDEAEAAKWFRRAAEQNYALAQSILGACYEYGSGVAQDQAQAVKWYRKAAEQDFA